MYVLKHNNMMILNENSLVLEFGVAFNKLKQQQMFTNQIVYGFDSFQDYQSFGELDLMLKFSTSNGKAPIFEEKNIKIIDGLFEETWIFFQIGNVK